jgi:hypothetical protein
MRTDRQTDITSLIVAILRKRQRKKCYLFPYEANAECKIVKNSFLNNSHIKSQLFFPTFVPSVDTEHGPVRLQRHFQPTKWIWPHRCDREQNVEQCTYISFIVYKQKFRCVATTQRVRVWFRGGWWYIESMHVSPWPDCCEPRRAWQQAYLTEHSTLSWSETKHSRNPFLVQPSCLVFFLGFCVLFPLLPTIIVFCVWTAEVSDNEFWTNR